MTSKSNRRQRMVLQYDSVQQKARIETISIQDCQADGSLAGKLSARVLSIALSLLCFWLQSSITRSSGSRSCLSSCVSIAPPVTTAILPLRRNVSCPPRDPTAPTSCSNTSARSANGGCTRRIGTSDHPAPLLHSLFVHWCLPPGNGSFVLVTETTIMREREPGNTALDASRREGNVRT
jgi:hypothetical protein